MSRYSSQTKILAEGTIIVALSVTLKDFLPPILQLPQGGSVSVAGMLPLLWFSLRRGLRSGMEAGAVYGLVHMALGGYIVNPVQAILDYPLAFAALGLAGLFSRSSAIRSVLGVGIGIFGRFICHFVSGIVFFAIYAPEGMNAVLYSAIYNGGYLLVEFVISAIIIFILAKRRLLEIYI